MLDEGAANAALMSNDSGAVEGAATKRQILADIASITVAGYLVQPMMFVSTLLVRREIGPFFAGTLATLTLVQSYTSLLNLGVLQAAERELPFLRGANDQDGWARMRIASVTVTLLAGALIALGICTFVVSARARLGEALAVGLLFYSVLAVLGQWSSTYLAFVRAEHRFRFLSGNNVLFGLLTAAANVTGAYLLGYRGVLISTLTLSVAGAIAYTREVGLVRPAFNRGVLPDITRLLTIGLPLFILSLIGMAMHTVDSVVTLKLMGTEALGMYTLALSGGNFIFGVANSACTVLYPRMQESHGKHRNVRALLEFVVGPTQILALALPLLIAPLFVLLPVIVTSFVPKFVPGIPAFHVLVVGISFYALVQIPKLTFFSLGKVRQLMFWAVFTTGACVGAATVLVKRGLVGVPLATTIGHLVAFIGVSIHILGPHERARGTLRFLGGALIPVAYAALLLAAIEYVSPVASAASLGGGLLRAAGKLTAFYVAYAVLLLVREPRTHLIRNYLVPALSKVVGRVRRPI